MKFTLDFLEVLMTGLWLTLPVLVFFAVAVFALGQVVGRLEKWTVFDAWYWSFITAFTVGYGDIRPVRRSARIIAIVIAMLGIMFTGIVVAITVQAASSAFQKNVDVKALIEARAQATGPRIAPKSARPGALTPDLVQPVSAGERRSLRV